MIRFKELSKCDPKDLHSTMDGAVSDISLRVVGLFDTIKMLWTYHVVSTGTWGGKTQLTGDLYPHNMFSSSYTVDNVKSYGRKFDTREEADTFVSEFRVKWETASNNTIQEIRDEKLKELTDEK